MVTVNRDTDSQSCNSCVDRDKHTHKVTIGPVNFATILHLCAECLDDLYNESAEALNY